MHEPKTLIIDGMPVVVPAHWDERVYWDARTQSNAVIAAMETSRRESMKLEGREKDIHMRDDEITANKWASELDTRHREREHEMGLEAIRVHSDTALAITARFVVGAIVVTILICTAWLIGKFF